MLIEVHSETNLPYVSLYFLVRKEMCFSKKNHGITRFCLFRNIIPFCAGNGNASVDCFL
ncbi:MAG: hypothetical protein JWO58_461 [Chitinophagaceae bacterium]|nr:hypothetical protein [Chitinophagaceae bacterium]